MGEVYKAKDTRLDRLVAVKVCRDQVSDRFAREARAVAALNHPKIVALFDTGDNYFVTELIDGASLRNSQFTPRRAIEVAIQIADGLAAAHAVGIAHRDLQPDNVMLTKDGRAKILDFGLARHRSPNEPTDATRTLPGTIMGTVGYMSPEQVRGEQADHRSDIFSFGAMLYEMLANKRVFSAGAIPEIMTAILKEDAPELPAAIPAQWREVVRHCMEKEPAARFQSAKDLGFALRSLLITSDSIISRQALPAVKPSRAWLAYALAATAAVSATVIGWFVKPKDPIDLSNYRLIAFASESFPESDPAWSPDGKSIAYVANGQIFTRRIDSPTPDQLTHGAGPARVPFWSKSGDRIYFSRRTGIWSVAAIGGAEQKEIDGYESAALAPDGVSVVVSRTGEIAFGKLGGTTWTPYGKPPFDKSFRARYLKFAPDGTKLAILFSPVNSGSSGEVWLVPFPGDRGEPKRIFAASGSEISTAGFDSMPDSRHLVIALERGDSEAAQLYIGDSVSGSLRQLTASLHGVATPAISPNGKTVAFAQHADDSNLVEILLDGSAIRPLLATSRSETDGSWLANGREFAYLSDANGIREPWIRNAEDGRARPILSNPAASLPKGRRVDLTVAPDGDRMTISAHGVEHTIWALRTRGGAPVRLDPENRDHHGASWSPDGNWISFTRTFPKRQLVKVPAGGGTPVVIAEVPGAGPTQTAWSPTGEWIAWASQTLTLYAPDGKQSKKLANVRNEIVFSPDGSTLYSFVYNPPDKNMVVEAFDVRNGTSRIIGRFDSAQQGNDGLQRTGFYDFRIHPDGKRFIATERRTSSDIVLLEGF